MAVSVLLHSPAVDPYLLPVDPGLQLVVLLEKGTPMKQKNPWFLFSFV